jgi:signal transduction histidine kinase
MRIWPRSLFGRLLAIAALSTLAALLFAGVTIGGILERFVMHGLDDRLDAQVTVLARAVRTDGTLDARRAIDLPRFDEAGSGWQWEVDGPGGRQWLSKSGTAVLMPIPAPWPEPPHRRHRERADEPAPGEGIGPFGQRVHFRQLKVATPAGAVTITASGPRRIVEAPLREAIVPLLLSLGLLGCGLALATFVQLRFGLRPLRRLQAALADVRAGRARHIPADQPQELAPLASELNALIDENEAGLAHARRHVANLAHGLKTPLAALSVKLEESGSDPDGSLRDMVAQIDQRVRHHLGRARAAAPGNAKRAHSLLAPAVADLTAVMPRIHADRIIAVTVEIAADLAVAVDPQDLDEMLGNLIDNGWRHARAALRIAAKLSGSDVEVAIDDDGPGLSDAELGEALIPGRRLDERGDGHGFGLSITEELAELSGGALTLRRSSNLGGLSAILRLPGTIA